LYLGSICEEVQLDHLRLGRFDGAFVAFFSGGLLGLGGSDFSEGSRTDLVDGGFGTSFFLGVFFVGRGSK